MLIFCLKRIARGLFTILIVVGFAFMSLRLTSNLAMVVLGPSAPPAAIAAFRTQWGLNQPVIIQFFHYLVAILHGNFGLSMVNGASALHIVLGRIAVTLEIMLPSLMIGLLAGIALGTYAALHRGTYVDRLVMLFAISGFTVPNFVLGLTLVLIFSVHLGWLPAGRDSNLQSAILPIITLSTGWAAILARFTRGSMIEALDQPYILTASAKGMLWRSVVYKHALPNAAIPIVTMAGFMIGGMLAGAVVTESVFSWPGIGQLIVNSVASRDVSVVQCVLILVATTMVIANTAVDLLYGWLDPRLRRGHK